MQFHIRVHRPPIFDPSFVLFCKSVMDPSAQFIISREGGGYDKCKHRFIRPHAHIYIKTDLSHIKLRNVFKEMFPTISNNKDYSIARQKKDNLLSYILKGGNIVIRSGFTQEYIDSIPEWVERKQYFQDLLIGHINVKMYEAEIQAGTNVSNSYPGIIYRPYDFEQYLTDTMKFCREKDRWLPNAIVNKIAYKLDIISVHFYCKQIGLIKSNFLEKN